MATWTETRLAISVGAPRLNGNGTPRSFFLLSKAMLRNQLATIAGCLLLVCVSCSTAFAQTITTWSQLSSSGAWDVPGNWQTGQVPNTTGQSPAFTRAGDYEALLPAGQTNVADLIVGGPSGASVALRATGATDSTLNLSGDLSITQSNFTVGGSVGSSTVSAAGELLIEEGARVLAHDEGHLLATSTVLKPGTSFRSTGFTVRGSGSASLGMLKIEGVASPSTLRQATLTVEGGVNVAADSISIQTAGGLNRSNTLQLAGGAVQQSPASGVTVGGNAADGRAVFALVSGSTFNGGTAGVQIDLNGELTIVDSHLNTTGSVVVLNGSEASLRSANVNAAAFDFQGGAWFFDLGSHSITGPALLRGTDFDLRGGSIVEFTDDVDHLSGLIALADGTTLQLGGGYIGSGTSGNGAVHFQGGLVQPAGEQIGQLSLGGATQLESDVTLAIAIGGLASTTEHDQLQSAADVQLAGTLDVSLVEIGSGWTPTAGQSFTVIDAAGGITGDFDSLVLPALSAGLSWETTKTATTYELQIVAGALAGDYNADGIVDAADYTVWRATLGSTSDLRADGDQSSVVDEGDFRVWRSQFGNTSGTASQRLAAIPEPATLMTAMVLLVGSLILGQRRR